jgi:hypothetical protein
LYSRSLLPLPPAAYSKNAVLCKQLKHTDKMKFLLLLVLLVPASAAVIKYTSPTGDYSFEISEHTNTEASETETGYGEMFYIYNPTDSIVQYTISVTKFADVATGMTLADIDNEEFKTAMLGTCGCEIVSKEKGEFAHLNGVHYRLSFPGSEVRSFSYTTLKGDNLYTVNFQANGADLDLYRADYEALMNSMEIFK